MRAPRRNRVLGEACAMTASRTAPGVGSTVVVRSRRAAGLPGHVEGNPARSPYNGRALLDRHVRSHRVSSSVNGRHPSSVATAAAVVIVLAPVLLPKLTKLGGWPRRAAGPAPATTPDRCNVAARRETGRQSGTGSGGSISYRGRASRTTSQRRQECRRGGLRNQRPFSDARLPSGEVVGGWALGHIIHPRCGRPRSGQHGCHDGPARVEGAWPLCGRPRSAQVREPLAP